MAPGPTTSPLARSRRSVTGRRLGLVAFLDVRLLADSVFGNCTLERLAVEGGRDALGSRRALQQIALDQVTSELPQPIELLLGLHPFRHHGQVKRSRESYYRLRMAMLVRSWMPDTNDLSILI